MAQGCTTVEGDWSWDDNYCDGHSGIYFAVPVTLHCTNACGVDAGTVADASVPGDG